jgi:hypothetical protein
VRPATRASPSDHQRSRYTLGLIVLAISGESRAAVPFARPKKSIVTAALGTVASAAFAVVDRATKAAARVKLPLVQCQLMAPVRTLETKFAVLHKAAFLQRCGRVRPLGLGAPSGDSREAPYSPPP